MKTYNCNACDCKCSITLNQLPTLCPVKNKKNTKWEEEKGTPSIAVFFGIVGLVCSLTALFLTVFKG